MKTSPVLAVFLVSLVLVECSLFNTVSDELKIKTLLANKTELDSNVFPRRLFVQIKTPQAAKDRTIFAVESQNDFYIECQVNTELKEASDVVRIYWWYKPEASSERVLVRTPSNEKPPSAHRAKRSVNDTTTTSKMTIVSRVYIDCPSKKHQGEYFCVAVSSKFYHKSRVSLQVLVPDSSDKKSAKLCQSSPFKLMGPNPARIVEFTSVIFGLEHQDIVIKCRTESFANLARPNLIKNPKYKSRRSLSKSLEVGHIWLDNRNRQIKARHDDDTNLYQLLDNGDLFIRNLTYGEHFGQFACITRKGNQIDSVSTFIIPMKNEV